MKKIEIDQKMIVEAIQYWFDQKVLGGAVPLRIVLVTGQQYDRDSFDIEVQDARSDGEPLA
jgi:hypothetical protein